MTTTPPVQVQIPQYVDTRPLEGLLLQRLNDNNDHTRDLASANHTRDLGAVHHAIGHIENAHAHTREMNNDNNIRDRIDSTASETRNLTAIEGVRGALDVASTRELSAIDIANSRGLAALDASNLRNLAATDGVRGALDVVSSRNLTALDNVRGAIDTSSSRQLVATSAAAEGIRGSLDVMGSRNLVAAEGLRRSIDSTGLRSLEAIRDAEYRNLVAENRMSDRFFEESKNDSYRNAEGFRRSIDAGRDNTRETMQRMDSYNRDMVEKIHATQLDSLRNKEVITRQAQENFSSIRELIEAKGNQTQQLFQNTEMARLRDSVNEERARNFLLTQRNDTDRKSVLDKLLDRLVGGATTTP